MISTPSLLVVELESWPFAGNGGVAVFGRSPSAETGGDQMTCRPSLLLSDRSDHVPQMKRK